MFTKENKINFLVTITSGAILLGCGSGSCAPTGIKSGQATPHFAYFSNIGSGSQSGTYTQCLVNSSDGILSACKTTTLPDGQGSVASIAIPYEVTINNGYAYFANSVGTYTQCSVNSSNGILSNCTTKDITDITWKNPSAFTISNGYAYFANNNSANVISCEVLTDGTLNFCRTLTQPNGNGSASGLWGTQGIAISNGYAYFANNLGNSYTQCTVGTGGAGGTLSACNTVVPDAPGQLDGPTGVTISNGYAYFANMTGNSYTQCTVNSADGTLSACNTTTPAAPGQLDGPTGVSISNGYAYFANSGNNSYTKCAVSSANGTLSACNTLTPQDQTSRDLLDNPSGITIN